MPRQLPTQMSEALCFNKPCIDHLNEAPEGLKKLSGPCGPISVWLVLQKHGIEVTPDEIIKQCRYSEEYGTFIVCMAEALMYFGLDVDFYSDNDPAPKELELESYARVSTHPALSLPKLLDSVARGASVIVSYMAFGGEGHFSPLSGSKANKILLPYSIEGKMLKSEFNKRWRANEILRQSIIATT